MEPDVVFDVTVRNVYTKDVIELATEIISILSHESRGTRIIGRTFREEEINVYVRKTQEAEWQSMQNTMTFWRERYPKR